MNTTISGFTQAANQAQEWVNELSEQSDWSERRTHRLLRSVLYASRDWLTQEEMADLAAQLPALFRGIYFEGWKPSASLTQGRRKEEFVERIQHDMSNNTLGDPDHAIAAAFGLLDRRLDHGEITQARNSMKKALGQLWPTH